MRVTSPAQVSRLYSTDFHISNSLINSILQDRKGFIWIATEDGLNKFDGQNFTVYRNIPTDTASLHNNYTKRLYEDREGNLWVGCITGLMKYNPDYDNFRMYPILNRDGVQVFPHITSIIELSDGTLWCTSSGHRVIALQPGGGNCNMLFSDDELASIHLSCAFEDNKGRIWIGTENSGLNLYYPTTGDIKYYGVSATQGGLAGNNVTSIAEDGSGNIYIGTLEGLALYDEERDRFLTVPLSETSGSLPVKSLSVNDKGVLYVGTEGYGIKTINTPGSPPVDFMSDNRTVEYSRLKVECMYEDRDGNMWIGINRRGVLFLPDKPGQFTYYDPSFGQSTYSSRSVTAITGDRDGNIWMGTDNNGLHLLENGNYGHLEHHGFAGDGQLMRSVITDMVADDNGTLWITTAFNGVMSYVPATGRYLLYQHSPTDSTTISSNRTNCIFRDSSGNLWIGTNGGGLNLFSPETGMVIKHYHSGSPIDIQNNWITTVTESSDGRIWVGTYRGVSCIDLKTGITINYRPDNTNLARNVVTDIIEDSHGNMWVGTNGGLECYPADGSGIRYYSRADGLPSNTICAILEDDDGRLWITTHSGLVCFDVANGIFTKFNIYDGLQGNEFIKNSHYRAADGRMFFGGTNGATAFMPGVVTQTPLDKTAYITKLYIGDDQINPGDKPGGKEVISKNIIDARQITLSHKNNMFSLVLSTFEYAEPEQITYQYSLQDGTNRRWVNTAPGVNTVSFSGLRHGKYKFLVRAAKQGYSAGPVTTLSIVVLPPWWLTWWAKAIYILLVSAIAFTIFKLARNRAEAVRVKELNEAKLQFFINISHEIRTPLTLISDPLEKLIEEGTEPDRKKAYRMMKRNVDKIMALINQLMDVRKIDKGQMRLDYTRCDIVWLTRQLQQNFDYAAAKKNITLKTVSAFDSLFMMVDTDKYDKILSNLLSNALKYTPASGEITISLDTDPGIGAEGSLVMRVSDTGIGISEDQTEKIFDRFYQIYSEKGQPNIGTGVGLNLAQGLTRLMRGTIKAEARTGVPGTVFTVTLPLGSSFLTPDEIERACSKQPPAGIRQQIIHDHSETDQRRQSVRPKTKYRLLLADDDGDTAEYVRNILSSTYHVTVVGNGREALDFATSEKPDIIVSDVVMPKMDGITLCRKIKENTQTAHIPVVLLTAQADDTTRLKGLDTGADSYITKPFKSNILKKTIENLLTNRKRMSESAKPGQPALKEIKIKSADEALVARIMNVINGNIADPSFNVNKLSSEIGISRVHLHRKLTEIYNMPAGNFIRNIRLKKAGELLLDGKVSISDVAYALGFSSLSHFSTSFRDYYGMSPKKYVETHATTTDD